jgi:hypothetical protein
MTLQTEVTGRPPQIVTTVFYQGQVIGRERVALTEMTQHGCHQDVIVAVNRFHNIVQDRLSQGIQRKRGAGSPKASAVSQLFMLAVNAYGARDERSALEVLNALVVLHPQDERIRGSWQRLRQARQAAPSAEEPPSEKVGLGGECLGL